MCSWLLFCKALSTVIERERVFNYLESNPKRRKVRTNTKKEAKKINQERQLYIEQ